MYGNPSILIFDSHVQMKVAKYFSKKQCPSPEHMETLLIPCSYKSPAPAGPPQVCWPNIIAANRQQLSANQTGIFGNKTCTGTNPQGYSFNHPLPTSYSSLHVHGADARTSADRHPAPIHSRPALSTSSNCPDCNYAPPSEGTSSRPPPCEHHRAAPRPTPVPAAPRPPPFEPPSPAAMAASAAAVGSLVADPFREDWAHW